jgi:hypothetical protein
MQPAMHPACMPGRLATAPEGEALDPAHTEWTDEKADDKVGRINGCRKKMGQLPKPPGKQDTKRDIANELMHASRLPVAATWGEELKMKQAMCYIRSGGIFLAVLGCLLTMSMTEALAQSPGNIEQNFANSLTAVPSDNLGVSGAFYVPVYSSVSMSPGKLRADFSVTLSVHNASETKPLVLKRIAYFDTSGNMVESYLKSPIALKPFSTIEVFIATTDIRGGTGANFAVDWAATGEIAEPVVEALMVGGVGAGHYAFISQGRPVKPVGKN